MIQAIGLTSEPRRDRPPAVDDLTFEARPGRVTVLLGPGGAGKTTALRLVLQLERGRGVALLCGRPLHRVPNPPRELGVFLGEVPGHPARTVRGYLRMLSAAAGVPAGRADEVLDVVGLSGLADQRLGALSRGMDLRLGLAAALLGDPHTLVLDDPTDGVSAREAAWLHGLLRGYASQGGAVLVTGRDARQAARLGDRIVTIEEGRLVADQDSAEFVVARLRPRVVVRTPQADRLASVLLDESLARRGAATVEVVRESGNRIAVHGTTCAAIGDAAFRHGIPLHQVAEETGDTGPLTPLLRADGRRGSPMPASTHEPRGTGERGDSGPGAGAATPEAAPAPLPAPLPASLPGAPSDPTPAPDAPAPEAQVRDAPAPAGAGAPALSGADALVPGGGGAPVSARADVRVPAGVDAAQPEAPVSAWAGPSSLARADVSGPARAEALAPARVDVSGLAGGDASAPARGVASPLAPFEEPSPAAAVPAAAPARPRLPRPAAPGPAWPLRYEIRRAVGDRPGLLALCASLAVSLLLALLLARTGESSLLRVATGWPRQLPFPPAALGAGAIGALAFGQEFRYPALAPEQGAVPRRLGLLVAKLLVAAVGATLLAVAVLVVDGGAVRLLLGSGAYALPAGRVLVLGGWTALLVGCAWAGLLAAGVFRSTAMGLAAVLAVPVLVLPVVRRLLNEAAVRSLVEVPGRLRSAALLQWPTRVDHALVDGVRVVTQPVAGAMALSLAALLCAYVLTALRGRAR